MTKALSMQDAAHFTSQITQSPASCLPHPQTETRRHEHTHPPHHSPLCQKNNWLPDSGVLGPVTDNLGLVVWGVVGSPR